MRLCGSGFPVTGFHVVEQIAVSGRGVRHVHRHLMIFVDTQILSHTVEVVP